MNKLIFEDGHESDACCIAMTKHNSVSETKILSGDEDGTLICWSLNGQLLDKVHISHSGINSIICSGINTNIFYVSSGTAVNIIDLRKLHDVVKEIELGDEDINQLALNDNETYLAAADDSGNIKVYDLQGQKLYKTLRRHTNIASDLAFRPNRPLELISCGFDEMLLSWDIAKSRAFCAIKVSDVDTVDDRTREYVVSPAFVQSLSISANGNLLAIGTENALVQIYDSSKRILSYSYSILRHTRGVSQVRFLPESNTHLCSVANDGYFYIWHLPDFHTTHVTNGNDNHSDEETDEPRNNRNSTINVPGNLRNQANLVTNGLGGQGSGNNRNNVLNPVCFWNVPEKINWISMGSCIGDNYLLICDTGYEPYMIKLPHYS